METTKEPYNVRSEGGTFVSAITDDELWALYEELGTAAKVAKECGLAPRSIRQRLAKIRESKGIIVDANIDVAGALEKLVAAVPRDLPGGGQLTEIDTSLWEIGGKDALTQQIVKRGLDKIGAKYRFNSGTVKEFPLVQRSEPIEILYKDAPRILRQTKVIPVISDAQIGWLRHPETLKTSPIHDPTAMDVAKQIITVVTPDGIIFIGDWMDWQFLSRWQQHNEFDVVNPSIKTGTDELGLFCSAAGKGAEDNRVMIGSNHGDRPEKFILEHNRVVLGMRRGGDTSQWPVFSEQYLLHYDDLNLKFSGHFPGGEYYITPDLVCTHAPPKSKEFDASVFHGHDHKLRMTPYVLHSFGGRKERFVYDTGCMCRTDATTDKARMMVTNVPSNQPRTDWTQGIAVINIVEGKLPIHSVELIHIQNGRALYRGQEFTASKHSRSVLSDGLDAKG